MPSDTNDRDAEHRDLVIESLELQIRKLQIRLDAQRAMRDLGSVVILDKSHESSELINQLRRETEERLAALDIDIDAYNDKVRAHMGYMETSVADDIPDGVKGFLDAMFPGAIVIKVGGGPVMFGDFDAPEEKEPFFDPTDAVDAPG